MGTNVELAEDEDCIDEDGVDDGIDELSFEELGAEELTLEVVSVVPQPATANRITKDSTTHIALLKFFISYILSV